MEEDFKKCEQFLRKRENRSCNIYQLSEATGVDIKQITKFIREGRISIANNPNLGYPCEKCGNMITSGTYCDYCAKGFKRSIEQQLEVDQRLSEEQKRRRAIGYRSKTPLDNSN